MTIPGPFLGVNQTAVSDAILHGLSTGRRLFSAVVINPTPLPSVRLTGTNAFSGGRNFAVTVYVDSEKPQTAIRIAVTFFTQGATQVAVEAVTVRWSGISQ